MCLRLCEVIYPFFSSSLPQHFKLGNIALIVQTGKLSQTDEGSCLGMLLVEGSSEVKPNSV